jgi:hypothetical protein
MSFRDDVLEVGPVTLVVYRCRRCTELVTEAHDDATAALRLAVEAGAMLTIHECDDGASGVCELIGTGPGQRRDSRAA